MTSDDRLADISAYERFEYNSRLVGNRLLTRVPTYRTVADKLSTRFERYRAEYDRLMFVTHSQGGLVLQTFLSRMISAGKGHELAIIKAIIFIACPNGGSGIFLTPRRIVGAFMCHAQERRLRPLDEEIHDTHRHVSQSIDRAIAISASTCPIPIVAFAAESDSIVGRASAYGAFLKHGVLSGSHATVIRPRQHADAGYLDLRNELIAKLVERSEADTPRHAASHGDLQLPTTPARIRPQAVATNLPRRSVARLVGRDAEVAELLGVLRGPPGKLVLIDGTAGTGKTTLALHACHEVLADESVDAAVWLSARTTLLQGDGRVPTAVSASDLGDLTATIALTLARRDLIHLPPAKRAVGIAAALSEIHSIVVLDNFETVGDPRVLAYLHDLPQSCSVVITSRRRIDVAHRIHLQPLDANATEDLVRLELARRQLPRREQTVARLVELSGGIPLAVNWLIGRMALGAPHLSREAERSDDDELLRYLFTEALEQVSGSGGPLPLLVLSHPPGTVPSALLESVLEDLGLAEHEAARAISALSTLNLVEYDADSDRYAVLPVIKRFLVDRSLRADAEDSEVTTRLNEAYVRGLVAHLMLQSEVLWNVGYTHSDWDRDRSNTIDAIRSLLPDGKGQLAALLNAFYPFAITFGHFDEFMEYTGALLESGAPLDPTDTVELRARRASILMHAGHVEVAAAEFEIAESAFAHLETVSDPLANLVYFVRSIIAVTVCSPDAERILLEAIEFEQHRGVTWARLGFQGWLGLHLVNIGRLDEAEGLLTSSLDECRRVGDLRTSVFVHVGLARLRLARGTYDELVSDAPVILALASEFGEELNRAHLHLAVGRAYAHQSQPEPAREHVCVARDLYVRLGAQLDLHQCDQLLATLPETG